MRMMMVSSVDEPHASSLRTSRVLPPGAAQPCQPVHSLRAHRCLWPSRAAKGAGDRPGFAPGTPSTSGVLARGGASQGGGHVERPPLVQVPPAGPGALTKTAPPPPTGPGGDWSPKRHLGAAEARTALVFARSPGYAEIGWATVIVSTRLRALARVRPCRPGGPPVAESPGPVPRESRVTRGAGVRGRQDSATGRGAGGMSPWCRRGATRGGLGHMPMRWTSGAPQLRGCFVD